MASLIKFFASEPVCLYLVLYAVMVTVLSACHALSNSVKNGIKKIDPSCGKYVHEVILYDTS